MGSAPKKTTSKAKPVEAPLLVSMYLTPAEYQILRESIFVWDSNGMDPEDAKQAEAAHESLKVKVGIALRPHYVITFPSGATPAVFDTTDIDSLPVDDVEAVVIARYSRLPSNSDLYRVGATGFHLIASRVDGEFIRHNEGT